MGRGKNKNTELTVKQQMVLDFVASQIEEKGYPPSVREICAAIGFKSTSSAHAYLEKLKEKGLLQKDASKTRAIKVLETHVNEHLNSRPNNVRDNSDLSKYRACDNVIDFPDIAPRDIVNVPIVGKVTAGEPILAVENIDDSFPVPIDFVGNNDAFMLKVRGESMIEAGILDGDYVLVSKQNNASNGDIVVALIEDEATVKTFYKEKNYVRLQPENKALAPIIVYDNLMILGKVIGVFRKL